MPVFNTPSEWLQQSILSCLNQTFQKFELIIIDNGSINKDTIGALNRVKNIDKIVLINCPKQPGKRGVSIALNAGIKKAKYEYIARMDSDDWMYPDRLEIQFKYLQDNPDVDVLGTQMKILQNNFITSHPLILNKNTITQYNTGWFINHPTVMLRKNVFDRVGLYAEEPEIFPEDYELWSRCLKHKIVVHNLKNCLLNYNQHGTNASTVDATQKIWYDSILTYQKRFL